VKVLIVELKTEQIYYSLKKSCKTKAEWTVKMLKFKKIKEK